MSPILKIFRDDPSAMLPKRQHASDACYDLYSCMEVVLPPRETRVVDTGLVMEIPEGYKVSIYPRSGLSVNGIQVANAPGTIDSGYRNRIKVILYNSSSTDKYIHYGDRIGQMALEKLLEYTIEEVDEPIGSDTDRGFGGLGSTGQ